jgi:hypothetical protein
VLMSDPERDGRCIDAFLNQIHCQAVPQAVDRDALKFERRTCLQAVRRCLLRMY